MTLNISSIALHQLDEIYRFVDMNIHYRVFSKEEAILRDALWRSKYPDIVHKIVRDSGVVSIPIFELFWMWTKGEAISR